MALQLGVKGQNHKEPLCFAGLINVKLVVICIIYLTVTLAGIKCQNNKVLFIQCKAILKPSNQY